VKNVRGVIRGNGVLTRDEKAHPRKDIPSKRQDYLTKLWKSISLLIRGENGRGQHYWGEKPKSGAACVMGVFLKRKSFLGWGKEKSCSLILIENGGGRGYKKRKEERRPIHFSAFLAEKKVKLAQKARRLRIDGIKGVLDSPVLRKKRRRGTFNLNSPSGGGIRPPHSCLPGTVQTKTRASTLLKKKQTEGGRRVLGARKRKKRRRGKIEMKKWGGVSGSESVRKEWNKKSRACRGET